MSIVSSDMCRMSVVPDFSESHFFFVRCHCHRSHITLLICIYHFNNKTHRRMALIFSHHFFFVVCSIQYRLCCKISVIIIVYNTYYYKSEFIFFELMTPLSRVSVYVMCIQERRRRQRERAKEILLLNECGFLRGDIYKQSFSFEFFSGFSFFRSTLSRFSFLPGCTAHTTL